MKCPKCHFDNPADTHYCGKCGTPLSSDDSVLQSGQPADEISVSHTKTFETPVSGLSIGSTFAGRYEVIEDLGHGGRGEVYKVLDKDLDEEGIANIMDFGIARTLEGRGVTADDQKRP